MEVTKCDRCGAYVDKRVEEMPALIYYSSGENSDRVVKNLCYNCYADLERWLDINKEEEDANDD